MDTVVRLKGVRGIGDGNHVPTSRITTDLMVLLPLIMAKMLTIVLAQLMVMVMLAYKRQ